MAQALDCLIVGGGPAGLVAAVYLSRYRRPVRVVDAHESRAELIPLSHNLAGFPDGISGPDLLARMRRHAERYGVRPELGTVECLELTDRGFSATVREARIECRTVLLATGVVDTEPVLPGITDALRRGLLRHCPVCDGFEAIGCRVGVLGKGTRALNEALFLRRYAEVTLLGTGPGTRLTEAERDTAALAGIELIESPIREVRVAAERIDAVVTEDGTERRFDYLYTALGAHVRSELAVSLGADCTDDGSLRTDCHQETSVPGLFAAGDVVDALNQIGVAAGHAAIAATAIHNRLLPEKTA